MSEIYPEQGRKLLGQIIEASLRLRGWSTRSLETQGVQKTTLLNVLNGRMLDPVPVLRKISKYVYKVELNGAGEITAISLTSTYSDWRELERFATKGCEMTRYSEAIARALQEAGMDPNSDYDLEELARHGAWTSDEEKESFMAIARGIKSPSPEEEDIVAATLTDFLAAVENPVHSYEQGSSNCTADSSGG